MVLCTSAIFIEMGETMTLTSHLKTVLKSYHWIFLLSVGLASCGLCGNTVVSQTPSPDGTLRAVIYNRECGAMGHFTTHVSIIPANSTLPNEEGNALVMEDDARFANISAHWLGPRTIVVLCHPLSTVYKLEHKVHVGIFGLDSVSFDLQDEVGTDQTTTPILQLKIEEILAKCDPEALMGYGCPKDEYRPEAKALLEQLPSQASIQQIQDSLNEVFHAKFDLVYSFSPDGKAKNLVRINKSTDARQTQLKAASEEIYSLLVRESP